MGAKTIDRTERRSGPQPAERIKILVVDDQPENLLAAEAVLESLGQEVVRAQSGREALRHLLADDFAVILLDVMMPEMDGWQVLKALRADERTARIPVAMVSARTEGRDKIIGLQEGAVSYVEKPFSPAEIVAEVRTILGKTA
jgi:CheY-like chemotaxis protein